MNRLSLLLVAGFVVCAARAQIATNPLPVLAHYPLGFTAAQVLADAPRGVLYVSDPAGQRVLRLRLADGRETGSLAFTNIAERLALTPDGKRLLVSLPLRPHDSFWFENQEGYVGYVDLDTFTLTKQVHVSIDPYDLQATSDGTMVLSSGSGQWTYIQTCDLESGASLGDQSGVIYMMSHLILHPAGDRLYVFDWNMVQRLDRNPATGAYYRPGNPILYPGAGNCYLHPDGDRLLTTGGQLLSSSAVVTDDLQWIGRWSDSSLSDLAFDPRRPALFVAHNAGTAGAWFDYHHSRTLVRARPFQVGLDVRQILFVGDELVVAGLLNGTTVIQRLPNPAVGAETNQAPAAAFDWLPASPNTLSPVQLDATASSDDQNPAIPLEYRWDLGGDGTFETAYSTNARVAFGLNLAGDYQITLEVKDQFGFVGRTQRTVTVASAEDPGEPGPVHAPFLVPANLTDVAVDRTRSRLYGVAPDDKRLVVVDLATGLVLRQFSFFRAPEHLTISPDQRWLYVTVPAQPHNSFADNQGAGYVAAFDLDRLVKTHEIFVDLDPWNIVATDDRRVIISGGSGQTTFLRSYAADTGQRLGSVDCTTASPVLLDPQQRYVLTWYRHTAGGSFNHIRIDPVTGALAYDADRSRSVDVYLTEPVAFDSAGSRLVTSYGYVIGVRTADGAVQPPEGRLAGPTPGNIALKALAFDTSAREALFGVDADLFYYWNPNSHGLVNSTKALANTALMGLDSQWVYFLSPVGGSTTKTQIDRWPNPAAGAETNQPPVARFTMVPEAPTTRDTIRFDASTATDDLDQTSGLKFAWDWDGDGVFDTAAVSDPYATNRFWLEGTRTVGLRVYDRFGKASDVRLTFEVKSEPDPGEAGESNTPMELPFLAADVVFDGGRSSLFATDPTGRSVIRMNLTNGLIAKRWSFEWPPEHLAVTPNHRKLYATLLRYPHDYVTERGEGYLAEFDLENDTLARLIRIDLDPWELVATDDGWLVVGGGSAQSAPLDIYRAADGQRTDRFSSIRMRSNLATGARPDLLYGADTDLSPSRMFRFAVNRANGRFAGLVDFPNPPQAEVYGRAFPLPDGQHVLARSTQLFDANTLNRVGALNTPSASWIEAVVALPEALLLGRGDVLTYLDRNTLAHLQSVAAPYAPVYWVGVASDAHYAVARREAAGQTVVMRRRVPSTEASGNQAPFIRLLAPTDGVVVAQGTELPFRADAQDEDGTVAGVRFILDGKDHATLTGAPPFVASYYSETAGAHVLQAVATDNFGATSQVASVAFRVTRRPEIVFSLPAVPAVFDSPATFTAAVNATDADGTISRVEFSYESPGGNVPLATLTSAPWAITLTNVTADLALLAVAYDNDGVSSSVARRAVHLAGPNGDEFYRPFELAGADATVRASNAGATAQPDEPSHASRSPEHSLWWRWVAPKTGIVRFSTAGSNFDTVLSIYTGTVLAELVRGPSSDDALGMPPHSEVKLAVTAGATYSVAVDGANSEVGDVLLSVVYIGELARPPENDKFVNRELVAGTNWVLQASNDRATLDLGERTILGTAQVGASVWWQWTSADSGTATLTTAGSQFDTVLAIYAGPSSSVPITTPLATNDDDPSGPVTSRVTFAVTAGKPYYFCVAGWAGMTGDITLALSFVPSTPTARPPNDNFAQRVLLEGDRASVTASNANATREPGEPVHGPGSNRSVWWAWTAGHNGPVYVSISGVNNPICAVYVGDALPSLERPISWTPGTSKRTLHRFEAVAGLTYAIAVDAGGSGLFTLTLNAEAETAPIQLSIVGYGPQGQLILQVGGSGEHRGVLELSADLVDWQGGQPLVVSPGTQLTLPTTTTPAGFYRLRLLD